MWRLLDWGPLTVSDKEIRDMKTPAHVYDNLHKKFNPVDFDAVACVRMPMESGFRYTVFVIKHHDGFAM
jgi:alpha-L-fucosidase